MIDTARISFTSDAGVTDSTRITFGPDAGAILNPKWDWDFRGWVIIGLGSQGPKGPGTGRPPPSARLTALCALLNE